MKFTTEPLENRQVSLTIEVEPERVQSEMQKAARRLAGRGRIPGYRKGKAPYAAVARHYGEEAIFEEMLDGFMDHALREALQETGIQPYAPAILNEITQDPLTLKLTVPLAPEVDLGNYREIRKEFPEVTVSDEEVNEALERIRRDQGSWVPVDRPAEKGDMIFVTFTGTVDGETVFEEPEDFPLIVGETYGEPLPGFSERLAGAKPGDDLEFTLTAPDDHPRGELAGKTCEFRVHVVSVRTLDIPPLDDDLAKMVGDYETLDALRARVREALLEERKRHAEDQFEADVLDMIVAQSSIQYPPVALEEELDEIMEDIESQLKQQDRDLDSYLNLAGQTREQFRESLKPRAERNLHRSLVLARIRAAERIEVDPREFTEAYEELRDHYLRAGVPAQALEESNLKQRFYAHMLTEKVLERVRQIAMGQAPEIPADDEDLQDSDED
ncbi:MAG: trigger factor [Anaerolineae bacterium]|nr:trigger factor [Anaerolineae bacterium]